MKLSLVTSALCLIVLVSGSSGLKPEISASLRKSFMKMTGLGRDRPKVGTVQEPEQSLLGGVTDDQDICDICEIALKLFIPVIEIQSVYPKMVEFAKYLCIREKWFTDRVCNGAVDMFKEEVYALLPVIDKSPHWACSKALKLKCGDDDDPMGHWWNVTIPPELKSSTPVEEAPVQNKKRQQNGPRATLQILHLSDLHMDPWYVAGSEGNCTEPLCCRADSPSPSDPSGRRAAGKVGDYKCDTPPQTMTSLMSQIAQQHQIDAVYITGDYTPHDVWNQTRERHKSTIDAVVGVLKKSFGSTPVFMAVGNHEGMPVNAFPSPSNSLSNTQNMSWLYDDILMRNWVINTGWLPSSTAKDISHSGSYTTLLKPGWRVISINDNYCNTGNWWLYRNSTDPQEVLSWLVNWLHYAETNGERVHIFMHIPSGDSCFQDWSWNYYAIMYRFRKTIAAQFAGHTHDSYFTVYYDNVNFTTPTGINYIGPSVTTYSDENPAYQLLTVDADTMEVLDYDIYYVDLPQANSMGSVQIKKLYSAKAAFNMTDLSPASWHQLAIRMQTDTTLFQNFYSWLDRLAPSGACDAQCKRGVLCELHTGRSGDSEMCNRFVPPAM